MLSHDRFNQNGGDQTPMLDNITLKIQTATLEIQTLRAQKAWAERQMYKLEKELKQGTDAISDIDKASSQTRCELRELEKRSKPMGSAFQSKTKKLVASLRSANTEIEELNRALRGGPKRRAIKSVASSTTDPIIKRRLDNGLVLLNTTVPASQSNASVGTYAQRIQREQRLTETENDKVRTYTSQLNRKLGRDCFDNSLSGLCIVSAMLSSKAQGSVQPHQYDALTDKLKNVEHQLDVYSEAKRLQKAQLQELYAHKRV